MHTLLIVILILLLLGAFPVHARFGPPGSGLLGLVIVILLFLFLLGRL